MSYGLGKKSAHWLETAHSDWGDVVRLALRWGIIDFSVTESHRVKGRQNRLYILKKSRVKWPRSKHNSLPSEAIDLVPWVNGAGSYDRAHCLVLAGVILAAAAVLGVVVRWGGNWDMDGEPVTDQDFQDLVHFEKHTKRG
jgi:hypothetical protein